MSGASPIFLRQLARNIWNRGNDRNIRCADERLQGHGAREWIAKSALDLVSFPPEKLQGDTVLDIVAP